MRLYDPPLEWMLAALRPGEQAEIAAAIGSRAEGGEPAGPATEEDDRTT